MMQMVYSGLASLGPVYILLHFNEPLEIMEGKQAVDELSGEIEFQDVTLVYTGSGRHALRDMTIKIKPGETVALVGESGAGKSTFANLVLGFYVPAEGRILIDGRDITEINLRTLRERIGVVSQDNVLLNTSIRENLMYGNLHANEEMLRTAASQAHALEFIERLPNGFDAVVGDRGTRLSGGQRQRLAIARALLKDPSILILDEATSALDSESEAKIQQAIERLRVNRTCLIIAHRLSTIMAADRILVLRDGRLVEQGSHAELLTKDGEYARLCERQFGDAIEEMKRNAAASTAG
jgi:ATP-binding cassette subfamily B protein